jgi:hypothetical protein
MKLRPLAFLISAATLVLVLSAWLLFAQTTLTEAMGSELAPVSTQLAQNIELVGQIGGPAKAVASQGGFAYVVTGPRLVILDISDPANPFQVGSYEMSVDFARDVAVAGDYAYIANDEGGLRILDVSDRANPVAVGTSDAPTDAWAVAVVDDYAYVADRSGDMHIIDVFDPTSPTLESTFASSVPATLRDVAVTPGPGPAHAYLGASNHLFVVDVTDPSNPSELGLYPTTAQGVAPAGSLVYVAAGDDGLRVIDVSQPHTPSLVDTLDTPEWAYAVALSGTHAYVADSGSGLRIIDISTPSNLSEDGFYDTPDSAEDVAMTGHYALVADDERGLRILDVSAPGAPVEEGAYDVPSAAWSVAVSGTLAYVGDYYMVPGSAGGALRIVDVSDPANPAQAGFAELSGRGSGVALSVGYAYLSGEKAGLLVADITDPFSPTEVISYPTTKLAHDVAVMGDYAYLADSWDLYLFDISDPLSPTLVSTWPTPGDSLNNVVVAGNYAYVGAGHDGLRIVDVSDPLAPIETGVYTVSDRIYDVALLGDLVYLAADQAGLHIVDVSDPISPTLAGVYNGWEIVSSVTAAQSSSGQVLAYILGEYWVDNGQWYNGLSVLDVSDPASPVEVGFYNLMTEAQTVAVAEDSSGQSYIYLANQPAGLKILRLRYRLFLPVVLRNFPS